MNPIDIICPLCGRETSRPGAGVQRSPIDYHDWHPNLREICAASGLTVPEAHALAREGHRRVVGL